MATRQNKKRKGRPNAPPRERTVTTLTDGPEGSFMPSPLPDYEDSPTAALLSPPFSVPTPLSATSPAALAGPFPLSPFSASFPYHNFVMSPLAGPPFQSQHSPPQFFAPQQPQSIPQPLPAQHVLPSGQNDLEILERLKQTIKNNQHELFRPVPQPAALANVYLGPKSTLVSHVAPHPEQLPSDPSPPGLTLLSHDTATKDGANVSTANILNQSTARIPSQSPHARDGAKKPPHRSSVSESPKNNVLPAFLSLSCAPLTDITFYRLCHPLASGIALGLTLSRTNPSPPPPTILAMLAMTPIAVLAWAHPAYSDLTKHLPPARALENLYGMRL